MANTSAWWPNRVSTYAASSRLQILIVRSYAALYKVCAPSLKARLDTCKQQQIQIARTDAAGPDAAVQHLQLLPTLLTA
jgi:hypothetical protein